MAPSLIGQQQLLELTNPTGSTHLIPSMSRGDVREKISDTIDQKKRDIAAKMSESKAHLFTFFFFLLFFLEN